MIQYDVFENPIPRARRDFPLVIILQSEVADTGHERIVAPLVPRKRMPAVVGRLTPVVGVAGMEHVLLIPRMTAVAATDLRVKKGHLTDRRDDIISAIDLLFLGI